MTKCIELPKLGHVCTTDLQIQAGPYVLDLTHPSVFASLLLGSAILVFVFRDPT